MSDYLFANFHCLNKSGATILHIAIANSDGYSNSSTFIKYNDGRFDCSENVRHPDLTSYVSRIALDRKLKCYLNLRPTYSSIIANLQKI